MPTPSGVNNLLQFLMISFQFPNLSETRIKSGRSMSYVLMLSQPIGNLILKFNNYSAWSAYEVLLRKHVDKTSSIPFMDCCDANLRIIINNKKKSSEIFQKNAQIPNIVQILTAHDLYTFDIKFIQVITEIIPDA